MTLQPVQLAGNGMASDEHNRNADGEPQNDGAIAVRRTMNRTCLVPAPNGRAQAVLNDEGLTTADELRNTLLARGRLD